MTKFTNLSISQLVDIYNQLVTEKPVKKFKDKATALARTRSVIEAANMVLVFDADGGYEIANRPAEKAKAASKRKGHSPKPLWPETARIRVLVEKNPKRKGSMAARRFEHYRDGMTIGEYLDAVEGLTSEDPRYTNRRDIVWDERHGFIRVEG